MQRSSPLWPEPWLCQKPSHRPRTGWDFSMSALVVAFSQSAEKEEQPVREAAAKRVRVANVASRVVGE